MISPEEQSNLFCHSRPQYKRTAWLWRWVHYDYSKCEELFTLWHCVTSHKTWIVDTWEVHNFVNSFLTLWDRASIMYSFKYNQQDATLYNILYYCQCSTCFRRFLRSSSGAQNCTHNIWYMSSLLAATASSLLILSVLYIYLPQNRSIHL
jgi:hypothetical protein